MLVKTDAELREGATARLRYTTPLGELFVDITNPAKGTALEDGDTLALADTSTAPTVEDALAQASLLVNGGGLEQLQTVTEELNTAIGGREDTVRTLLGQAETFLTEANATTADIDRALQALSSVSKTLRGREEVINRAVREIRPAAQGAASEHSRPHRAARRDRRLLGGREHDGPADPRPAADDHPPGRAGARRVRAQPGPLRPSPSSAWSPPVTWSTTSSPATTSRCCWRPIWTGSRSASSRTCWAATEPKAGDDRKAGTPRLTTTDRWPRPRGGLLDPLKQLSLTGLLGGLLG